MRWFAKFGGAIISAKRSFTRFSPAKSDLAIIVPAFNAEPHIGTILRYYKDVLNVPVRVFVDAKTTDRTFDIAKQFATEVSSIRNLDSIIEPVVEAMSKECGAIWALRIDDDELPTRAMLDFVQRAIRTDQADAYGFVRPQCMVSPEGRMMQWTNREFMQHPQWRLYRVDRVSYIKTIHSPGFRLPPSERLQVAPPDACLIHLDWAVRNFDERKQKLERYEAHSPGAGSDWRRWTLFEENSVDDRRFVPFPGTEFDAPARELAALGLGGKLIA